ncbi:outer membrane protein assembly factor BamD, partial [bacterium]|nr:outer membrane protein assembly factor BamD [bacterium]
MKIQYYRNQIARILFTVFFMAICSISIADDALTEAVDGIYRRGVASYDYKDYKAAMKQFQKMQKEFPMSKHSVRGWEYIAQCENALGDKYASFEAYQKIWDNHKNFNKLSTITKNQMNIADDFFKLKRYKIAIELYSKILENAPHSDSAASAQYSIAHSLLEREDYYASKEEFIKLMQNYPKSQLIDDAAYNLGYVNYLQSTEKEYDQTATTQAIAAFRQFIHQFPSSPNVYNAQKYIQKLRNRKAASLFRTGEYYENIRAPKAASISFREVIDQYPDTDYALRARNKINEINDSKTAKSVQAQKVVEMVRLENQKALAHNRDIASREKIEQKKGQVETKTDEVSQKPAEPAAEAASIPATTTEPDIPESVEQKNTAESIDEIDKAYAVRIKELYMDPELREELRLIMKEAYLKETLHDKERKLKWQQQKMVKQAKPAGIDIQQKKVEQVASANIDSKPDKDDRIPETFQIEEKKGEHSYNNEKKYSGVDTGNEELSVEYKTVDVPSKEIESQVNKENIKEIPEEKKEDESEFAIDDSELNDIMDIQDNSEKKENIQLDVYPVVNNKIIDAKKAKEAKAKEAEAK